MQGSVDRSVPGFAKILKRPLWLTGRRVRAEQEEMRSERYLGLDHTRSCRSLADWMWCVRERGSRMTPKFLT